MTPDKTWKAAERKIAAMLGGKRAGPLGKRGPDVVGDIRWAPEVKTRKRLPAWLLTAMLQADLNSPKDKTPIVILHEVGRDYDEALVLMRLGDFMAVISQE